MTTQKKPPCYPTRRWFLLGLFSLAGAALLWRAVDLQVLNKEFYRHHGDARALRVVEIPAHRGEILDRHGEPLAISTPVASVWAVPGQLLQQRQRLPTLAAALDLDAAALVEMLQARAGRKFVYLKRHLTPDRADEVAALGLQGVHVRGEYKRYYPAGEVAAHLIGFTDIDDQGQEGIELAYEHWLQGRPGSKRVLKDRIGRVVQDIESIAKPVAGRALVLGMDRRIQYLAYRALKAAMLQHKAASATLVMLDVDSGEIVAMAAQPSYNPNNRKGLRGHRYRNRAVTDVFEPGSTLKPFTVMAALLSGLYAGDSLIDTQPGSFRIGGHTVVDISNYGLLDIAGVLKKSSNVGASKVALALGPERIWDLFTGVGFGRPTGSGYPGEAAGLLSDYQYWSEVDLAWMAFGYGIAVTTLQLAQAYAVIASGGIARPVSLQKVEGEVVGSRVLPEAQVLEVRAMMEGVVQEGGGGQRAAIKGYKVAGKTGTVHKAAHGAYADDRYVSVFAGMAPATAPRLVLVVAIDEPSGAQYFGGQVAAPVFSQVMEGALRLLNIAPDDLPSLTHQPVLAGQPPPALPEYSPGT